MIRRALPVAAIFTVAGLMLWYVAWRSARASDLLLDRLEPVAGQDEARAIQKEMTVFYAKHPKRAWADYEERPQLAAYIVAAAAPNPECRGLVETALRELPPAARFYIILCLATGGSPTFENGAWTGTDTMKLPPEWLPPFLKLFEEETAPELLILYSDAMRSAGWRPDAAALVARSKNPAFPPGTRAGALLALVREPGGPKAIYDALESSDIPDDVAAALLNSGILAMDPAYRAFVERFALSPAHARAASGAFHTLAAQFPDLQEPIWNNLRLLPAGSRAPLLRSLLRRADWPPSYKAWFIMAWDGDASGKPEVIASLREGAFANLPGWIQQEKNEMTRRALTAILDQIRK